MQIQVEKLGGELEGLKQCLRAADDDKQALNAIISELEKDKAALEEESIKRKHFY